MNFTWRTYQELAQQDLVRAFDPIVDAAMREALLRSAISRAYYAIFVLARNQLRDKDGDAHIPSYGIAHGYVIGQFLNNRNNKRQFIGRILRRLRGLRNRADYDDVFPNLTKQSRNAVAEAKRVINVLDNLR